MADLGQMAQLRFDLRDEQSLIESIRHSDIVYNLIGRDYPTKNFSLEKVHVDGARQIARLAREAGVNKLVHVSALNADVNSKSTYLRTKALGEQAVLEEFPHAIIVRPSQMYGHEDRFWNRFGWFLKWCRGSVPVVNGGKTKMRPTYVGDVAAVLANQINDHKAVGKVIELAGPNEYYYLSLVQMFGEVTKRHPYPLHLPKPIAKLAAGLFGGLQAYPIITAEDIERLFVSDSVDPASLKFEDFGINPLTVEDTVYRYVRLYRPSEFQRAPMDLDKSKKYTTDAVQL